MKQKIALVHDYLYEAGGAERVLRVLSDMYPDAPVYTSFIKNGSARALFTDRTVIPSSWGWFLGIGRFYSYFRFLLPWVWKSIDLTSYDFVITSCSGYIARGFRVRDDAVVIAYCHTPPKWLYGYETPTGGQRKWWGKVYLTLVGPLIRYFDYVSAQRVNRWIANSEEVARRITKFYRHKAHVVYPPAITEAHSDVSRSPSHIRKEYYLTVARVVGAKGLVEAARAACEAQRLLIVVGENVGGRQIANRVRAAGGQYVEMKGRVSDQELSKLYAGATGYIALARDEDFGMTVVEAMSYGIPVVALNSGGYKETVIPGETGVLIDSTDPRTVATALTTLESISWNAKKIIAHARRFDRSHFEKSIRKIVDSFATSNRR